MKKKLVLINPDYELHVKNFYEPIELGIIASLTPVDNWDISIVDLRNDSLDDIDADLAAVTARILTVNAAYNILGILKQRGITTVLGGIHASLFPDESAKYADCVVVGEAESIWTDLLDDFDNHQLKKRYYGSSALNYTLQRKYYRHQYKTASVQMSRGCPLACDFCCIVKLHKSRHHFRPVDLLVEEIKNIEQKTIFFSDENMYGFSPSNREHVIELFKKLIDAKTNKHWIGMVSVNAGMDEEFLYYARKSGCRLLIIGFESEEKESLLAMNKVQNAKHCAQYKTIVKNIHKQRIALCGVFIFGLENDTTQSIEKRKKYILNSAIDSFLITLLTPLPGSALFDRHREAGNLRYTNFPNDWDRYNFYTIHCKNNTIKDIDKTIADIRKQISRPAFLAARFIHSICRTRSLSAALYANFYMCNHRSEVNKVWLLRIINRCFEKIRLKLA